MVPTAPVPIPPPAPVAPITRQQSEDAQVAAAKKIIETAKVYHGKDTGVHEAHLHQRVAGYLNNVAHAKPVSPDELKPISTQTPGTPELAHIMKPPKAEQDFADWKAGNMPDWMGKTSRVRTDHSGNFLAKLKEKIAKKTAQSNQELPKAA